MSGTSRHSPRIAILGGGVMGCCTALCLAERGLECTLLEQCDDLMPGASRWNEGKIHLGYLYAAAPNLDTASRVLPGGLRFRPILERLLAQSIDDWISDSDESYLFHRNSVVPFDRARRYFRAVDGLLAEQAGSGRYLVPLDRPASRELSKAEQDGLFDLAVIVGALRVPERSVATVPIADALTRRVREEPNIHIRTGERVTSVRPGDRGGWLVTTEEHPGEAFDLVVNALWAGRPDIDLTAMGRCDARTHHRYRVSTFIEGAAGADHPSVVIAAGPFGDVKHYGDGRYYASWYPAGLLAEGRSPTPPRVNPLTSDDRRRIIDDTRQGLSRILPAVADIYQAAQSIRVEGGWVYAQAEGALEEPASSLHRRDRLGIRERDGYFSVDTGKYASAPWLAEQLAGLIAGGS